MKATLFALPLVGLLAACSGLTQQEQTAMRDAAIAVAIEMIVEAKEAGLDPLQISESKLRLINIGCETADKLLPILEAYIAARNADDPEFEPLDLRGYVAAACAVAQAVVTVKPEADPMPDPAV